MNLHQALKQKNKLVGDLGKVNTQIANSTRWIEGNAPAYRLEDLMLKRASIRNELIRLKLEISKATQPILGKIFELAETKSLIQMYKNMNLSKGFEADGYRSTTLIKYDTAISEVKRDEIVTEMEEDVMKLQDEIDEFNAITKIME